MNPLLLIIDDEEAILKTLKNALEDESYHVETLSSGNNALSVIGKLIPDLVLLDIFMPNCNGLALLEKIVKEFPQQKVIIISGFGNIPLALEAIKKGAIDFIEKPLNLDDVLAKLDFLKHTYVPGEKISSDHDKVLLHDCHVIGESNLFCELIHQAEALAVYSFPIVIYGEYGTGKSTLAHYIHKKSLITQKPFVTTCTPEDFFSSQTIYIKDVDSLDLHVQKELSFFFENKETKARVIASSKTPLFSLVQESKFDETLFYLLNKAPLEIPPLRKRPYDIPLLISHYLDKYNQEHNKNVHLTAQSIRLLRNYEWPGNIIELQQTLQKIVVCHRNASLVTPTDLALIIGEKKIQFLEEQSLHRFNSLGEATAEFQKNFLLYLLKKNYYNIDEVSSQLNVPVLQLKNQLKELKIDIHKQIS
jgi:DNA-binding NtrC family response regulator